MECVTESFRDLHIPEQETEVGSFSVNDQHCDLDIQTNGGVVRAHKTVLRGYPYFAAMIDGNWVESQTSVIILNGHSYESVKFIIEHLYAPKERIEGHSDLVELAALADMLGLYSLLDLVCSTMISKACHNFHKPCQECISGVMTSYQLASTYNLVSLRSRCLEWITKYMTKTWNSRAFASLPEPLQTDCLNSVKNTTSIENVVSLTKDCQNILELLPSVKWVESVDRLVKQLLTSCMVFLQQHFSQFLNSSKFQELSHSDVWDVDRVEAILLEAAAGLPVEQTCLSYLTLENILQPLKDLGEDSAYLKLVVKLHKAVEDRLVQRVGLATKCTAWKSLPSAKQTSIMQLGFFNPMDNAAPKIPPPRPKFVSKRNQSLNASSAPCSKQAKPLQKPAEKRSGMTGPNDSRSTASQARTTAPARPQSLASASPRPSPTLASRPQSARPATSTQSSCSKTAVNPRRFRT